MIEWWGNLSFLKQKTLFSFAKFMVPLLILLLIFYEAKGLLFNINWALLGLYLDKLTISTIFLILFLGLIALYPMYFYDVILLQLFHIDIPKRKLFFYSLSANAFSNLVGFGGVAGATLRSYYYRTYLSDGTPYIKIIAKLSLFYLTGLSMLSWLVVFSDIVINSDLKFIKLSVWGIACYTPLLLIVFFFRKSFWNLQNLERGYIAELMMISIFEWIFVVICIWGIANVLGISVSFSFLFPIVILSACAGIASMIPGGIGSFDIVFLIGLESQGIPMEQSLLVLMFYRLSYYIVPVVLGTPFVLRQLLFKRDPRDINF